MHVDLMPLLNLADYPRRIVGAGEKIISAGEPADTLFILESGRALAAKPGTIYENGSLLSVLDMLALDAFRHDVIAAENCRIIAIPRSLIKSIWDEEDKLAWPLSCSIAASLTQSRSARLAG